MSGEERTQLGGKGGLPSRAVGADGQLVYGAVPHTHAWMRMKELGSSGIKFKVEGGEGSAGADTYIPLQKSFILASFFTENCDFAAFF